MAPAARSRLAAFALVLSFIGCREPAGSTDYVRIDGTAPLLENAPAARSLLVAFWATWCPPCRDETPQLRALAKDPPPGLQVVVISQDEQNSAVEEFFEGPPDPLLHLRLDPEKRLFDAFRVAKLPASFLIVDGRLRARFEGSRRWNETAMRDLLARLTAR
jgi:thiol-disulfide isomerase/thioredoxin